jgi:hypothetical protein
MHPFANFVSHTAKDRYPFLITAHARRGRILETLMNAPGLSSSEVLSSCKGAVCFPLVRA